MEDFILEIRRYALARGIAPSTALRYGLNCKHATWMAWCNGTSSPTVRTMDRMRKYIAANPIRKGENCA